MLLPADLVKDQPNLQLRPLGVIPQHDCWPRTISDYSYFLVNNSHHRTNSFASENCSQFVELACDSKGGLAEAISKIELHVAAPFALYKESCVPVAPTPDSIPLTHRKREEALAQGCHKSAF